MIVDYVLTVQLTLRRVMDTAKQVTKSGELNEFSMVLLNNTLSLPLGVLLIFVFNEVDYLSQTWVMISGILSEFRQLLIFLDICLVKSVSGKRRSSSIFTLFLYGFFYRKLQTTIEIAHILAGDDF